MKIRHSLHASFLILALLIILLGITGVYMQKKMTSNFDKYAGKVLPGAIEAVKMRAELSRSLEYALLYENTKKPEYRWHAWSSLHKLERNLTIYQLFSKDHVDKSILSTIELHTKTYIELLKKYLQIEVELEADQMPVLLNQMKQEKASLVGILRPMIDEDIIQTKNTQHKLKETAKRSYLIIMIVLAIAMSIVLFAMFVVYMKITRPITMLTDIAKKIRDGEIGNGIPDTLKGKNNEIGVLAQALSQTLESLMEVSKSRDALNVEINERMEYDEDIAADFASRQMQIENELQNSKKEEFFITKISNKIETDTIYLKDYLTQDISGVNDINDSALQNCDNILQLIHLLKEYIQLSNGNLLLSKEEYNVFSIVEQIQTKYNTSDCDWPVVNFDKDAIDFGTTVFIDKHVFMHIVDMILFLNVADSNKTAHIKLHTTKTNKFVVFEFSCSLDDEGANFKVINKEMILELILDLVKYIGGECESLVEDNMRFVKFKFPVANLLFSNYGLFNIIWNEKKFLIVDEHEIDEILIKECLERTDAKLIFVKNGEEALKSIKNSEVDVIFVDYKQLETDGFLSLKKIKEYNKSIPVIVNCSLNDDFKLALTMGCNDYIVRPYSNLDLIKLINKHLKS